MAKNLYLKRGTWWFSRQIEGKRTWVNLHTRDEAEAIVRKRLIEHNPQLRPDGTVAEDVDAFIAYKHARGRFSRNSVNTKVLILKEFAAWLPPGTTSASVSTATCSRFYAMLRQRVTESTAQSYMMGLRSFFRWIAEVKRFRLDNPVAKVEFARCDRVAREQFCERKQANELIEKAPSDDLRFILYCGFHAGLRRDEISEARRHWFDLRGGALNVRRAIGKDRLRPGEREWRPKYNKERTVPLTKPFRAFLKIYLEGLDPLDFALQKNVKHGKAQYRYDFRRPFSDFMRAEGVECTPHAMRHSFASNLKIAGKSIAKIADWLGDTERVTERNYAHLKPDDRDIHALA